VGWRSVPLSPASSSTREPRPRRNMRSCDTKIIVPSKFFGGCLMIYSAHLFIRSLKSMSYCRFKYTNVYIF
jgi:hypothetical protein